MEEQKVKIIYQDENLLVIDKLPGLVVFSEKPTQEKTIIDLLLNQFPYLTTVGQSPRYGIIHRLDKETSGILLVAKNEECLSFLQKQFKDREVVKKYITLIVGNFQRKQGTIETLIGRSSKNRLRQSVYFPHQPKSEGKRNAITEYKVLSKFFSVEKDGKERYYTLIEVLIKTGRKHQIRTHFRYLGYPIAGDKLYAFKNQPCPEGLERQFLHSGHLKIKLLNGQEQEFNSALPKDLTSVLKKLNEEIS